MQNCKEKGIFLQSINGYRDHLHCLISLGKEQDISSIAQFIKGESSHWLNQNYFINKEFMWQDDYFAISVSDSQVKKVVQYIKNQEQHHVSKTFEQEADGYNKIFGTNAIKNN